MKLFLFFFVALISPSFADNLLIPTCDLVGNINSFKDITSEELSQKAKIFVKRKDHCEAASALLEIYNRGASEESQKEVLDSMFLSLFEGKFLNEYTALMMGLEKNLPLVDLEKLTERQARLYLKFIPKTGRNPQSQFTLGSKNLKLIDEAEIVFRFFTKHFPENKLSRSLESEIQRIHDINLKNKIEYYDFYYSRTKVALTVSLQIDDFVRALAKNSESRYFQRALKTLRPMILKSDYEELKQVRFLEIISEANLEAPVETAKKLMALIEERQSALQLNNPQDLSSFFQKKGDDQILFFPLNDKFKLKAVQVLSALGVVGIVMAFDQPIHDFVLKNKNVGVLDEVADFGNVFGEPTGAVPLILGTLAIGLVFDNDHAKSAAISSIGALALTQLVVETMKYSINRSRPEKEQGPYDFNGFGGVGATRASFPSGHSAAAWSIATIFAQEFGDDYKWAPIVAYSVAAMTSYARLNKDKHWASDVVLGAMIGYVSGQIMHRVFKKYFKAKTENFFISPIIGKTVGLRVEIREKSYSDLKEWPLDTLYHFQQNVLRLMKKDPATLDRIYEAVYL